jgi:hypothetical protein
VLGSEYAMSLTAAGSTGATTWALAKGSHLPGKLTLRPDGTIIGRPTTTGTTTVTVQVTDSTLPNPASATMDLQIDVVAALKPRMVRLISGVNHAMTVGVTGSSSSAGATIAQAPDGQAGDIWLFTPIGGGYEILNQNSHLCLATDGIAGDVLYQTPCTAESGQLWQIPSGSGDQFSWVRNATTNLYLDVTGSSTAAGAPITASPWNGGQPNQTFLPK